MESSRDIEEAENTSVTCRIHEWRENFDRNLEDCRISYGHIVMVLGGRETE